MNGKRRTFAWATLELHLAAVSPDDVLHEAQAKSRALLCFANIAIAGESRRKRPRCGPNECSPSADVDDSIAREGRPRMPRRPRAANDLPLPVGRGTVGAHEGNPAGASATVAAAAGPGRCSCARLYGPEVGLDRAACPEPSVEANDASRHSPREWRRTTHRSTMELRRTRSQRR